MSEIFQEPKRRSSGRTKKLRPRGTNQGFDTWDEEQDEDSHEDLAGLAMDAAEMYAAEALAKEQELLELEKKQQEEQQQEHQENERLGGLAVHLRGSPEDSGPQVSIQAERGLTEEQQKADDKDQATRTQDKRAATYSEALVQNVIANNTTADGEININGVIAEISAKLPGTGKKSRAARDRVIARAKIEGMDPPTTGGLKPF